MKGSRARVLPLAACLLVSAVACEEQTPTAPSGEFSPLVPKTVEVRVPWSEFGTSIEAFGPFGDVFDLTFRVLANDFGGELSARPMARFPLLTQPITVVDSGGARQVDTLPSFNNGRLVVFFDTVTVRAEAPVAVSAHRVEAVWDPRTTSWTHAVDSAGDRQPWAEPGGPANLIATAEWDPAEGDSLIIPVDSVTLLAWDDTTLARGVRLELDDPGGRLDVIGLRLRYDGLTPIVPDTAVALERSAIDLTFIHDPVPEAPGPGAIRVGGAPAWRTAFGIEVPRVLNGPAEFCAEVTCPFTLDPDRINLATLELRSLPTGGFQPPDTLPVDIRSVLAPELLPRSPLSASLVGVPRTLGVLVDPAAFGPGASETVSFPITPFVTAQLEDDGAEAPRSLALLGSFEPATLSFLEFEGASGVAPVLRLLITVTGDVILP